MAVTQAGTPILLMLLFAVPACLGVPQCGESNTNETWYRHLQSACQRCSCKSDASVECSNVTCNAALCRGVQRDECCDACEGRPIPCLHNGRIYEDGEEFSSNATGLEANQCVHCVCRAGLLLCRLRTCLPLHCLNTCTGAVERSDQPLPVTLLVSDGASADCRSADVTYSHGSTWHPVIGPFGPMDCVFCKCQLGRIECGRSSCPPCPQPVRVAGRCCPQCRPQSGEEEGVGVWCLPPHTTTLVFRSHASSSSSAYYQFAFQSATGDRSTRLLTWTRKEGHIGDFSEQHLSKEEFKILTGTFKFKLQGATRTKFMEKFMRKAKKLPDHCGNRCATKIQRLEQVLHLREISQRVKCLPQETTFH